MPDQFMRRCIELAARGAGAVSPNPLVGAVVVHADKIIGEGWHKQYGGPHAEVHAIASVQDETLLDKSTLYVNLEPCSHHGKTPPCADLIIAKKIPRVVIGIQDPYAAVAGRGIQQLRDAGVEVITGVEADECAWLNRRFITYQLKKRPYVILKWAQSDDGYLAPDASRMTPEEFEVKRHITGFIVQKLVHRWRTEEDAILVGRNTVETDNPALNARAWSGRNPVRVIIDLELRLGNGFKVYDRSQPTFIFNAHKSERSENLELVQVNPGNKVLEQILTFLHAKNIQSLIVEGGRITLDHFIEAGLWDEAQVFRTQALLGAGTAAPAMESGLMYTDELDGSRLQVFVNRQSA